MEEESGEGSLINQAERVGQLKCMEDVSDLFKKKNNTNKTNKKKKS